MRNKLNRVGAVTALLIFISLQFLFVINPNQPQASSLSSTSAASPSFQKLLDAESVVDIRVLKLSNYLARKNSPMASKADKFVAVADKYNMDWRLVPAISGVESNFGRFIPEGSYNAYGWAGGNYRFESWEDSIETVTRELKSNYVDRGAVTVNQIGVIYCPPNSYNWTAGTNQFMSEIENTQIPSETLNSSIEIALVKPEDTP